MGKLLTCLHCSALLALLRLAQLFGVRSYVTVITCEKVSLLHWCTLACLIACSDSRESFPTNSASFSFVSSAPFAESKSVLFFTINTE